MPYTLSMPETFYPAHDIYLPSNNGAIKLIWTAACVSVVISFIAGVLILFGWIANTLGITFFDPSIVNLPIGVGIIAGCLSMIAFFQIKTNLSRPYSPMVIFGLCGSIVVILIGLMTLYNSLILRIITSVSPISISYITSFTFVFMGLSTLFAFIKIHHRFHYLQIFALIAISLNTYIFLNSLYRIFFSNLNITSGVTNSLIISTVLIIFCQASLLAKPSRGFFGLFTMNSLSSKLALRSLFYIIFAPPLLGGAVIMGQQLKFFDVNGTIPLLAISLTFMYIIITWLNAKFLYHLEQETYLMKEALRVNSISLELSAEDLTKKLDETEKSRKDVEDKFNNSLSLSDLVGDKD